MSWLIQLSELNYDKKEEAAVLDVIRSEWLTMGERSEQFEHQFSSFIQHPNKGVFVSSATAGLHLILMSLGVGPGDEVILPALTFVSDANVVMQLGAKPIFADSKSLLDFNCNEDDILPKINSKTKAIIVVHFAGHPTQLYKLKSKAQNMGIPIIEDCAHAPGAKINENFCGTLYDFSFFSFFSNKNLAIGEGGMVFAKDDMLLSAIRKMRSHGMSATTIDRHKGRASSYNVERIGLNYRADEIRAALGIEQLKKLKQGNKKRSKLTERYYINLRDADLIIPFSDIKAGVHSSFHIFPIILPKRTSREDTMMKMSDFGIQTSIHYPAFSSFSAYSDLVIEKNLPVSSEICRRVLTLPLHPRMTLENIDLVSQKLMEII